jgi:hypothetical protein
MIDLLARDNFIHQLLKKFYRMVLESDHISSALRGEMEAMDTHFKKNFNETIASSLLEYNSEEDDDQPTVVDIGDVW